MVGWTTIVNVRASNQPTQTFFDSEIPGIMIQVNATSESQPGSSIAVIVNLAPETNVDIDNFNLEVFGFANGTAETSLTNITDTHFNLNVSDSRQHSAVVAIPDNVWGIMYGQITILYSADIGGVKLTFPKLMSGFPMTSVKNTYLETLEAQVSSLNASNQQLNQTLSGLTAQFNQLNSTYVQLEANYTSIQGSAGELDNTRRLTAVLGIVAVFFVATTAYLIMKKPREAW